MTADIANPLARFAINIITMMLAVILAIAIVSVSSTAPGHDDIARQQAKIEGQLTFISCLLLIEPDERTPEAVASCQVDPERP